MVKRDGKVAFIPGSKPGTAQELNDYRNANFYR
uniref:Uncharacterized protein n=1 Tax=Myoviridae sp. ctcFb5 TaxID=2825137 RepID=A0A8S5PX55_9CAUD|nr:MAG TPA: hypothetical protein [Myoviridae sp. ctcFb5]DAT98817.1 MAG TPA: hypothetical protein [Caudoviricetes sp.]